MAHKIGSFTEVYKFHQLKFDQLKKEARRFSKEEKVESASGIATSLVRDLAKSLERKSAPDVFGARLVFNISKLFSSLSWFIEKAKKKTMGQGEIEPEAKVQNREEALRRLEEKFSKEIKLAMEKLKKDYEINSHIDSSLKGIFQGVLKSGDKAYRQWTASEILRDKGLQSRFVKYIAYKRLFAEA